MYLLVIVTLTMSAISLGSLLFNFVNIYLPDPAVTQCFYDSCASSVRWSISMLVVAFPVLVWAWRFLQKDVKKNPEKDDLRVRKWLLYLTLFVAGVTVIGDLISLINGWLQGELTMQFLLKVVTVFYIAGSIFFYFLRELHHVRSSAHRWVARLAAAVVAVSVIAGFVTAGSPASARDRRLDDQRVGHLMHIQSQIVDIFWTSKGRLPNNLDELRDSVSGFVPPTDPETGAAYEYQRRGDRSFTLCATFTTPTGETDKSIAPYPVMERGEFSDNWEHQAGRTCFDREIDPQLYPIR
jgi:hypothetical protein